MKRQFHVIGACSCWGAGVCACEKGPEDLQRSHLIEHLRKKGANIDGIELIYPDEGAKKVPKAPLQNALKIIEALNRKLALAVRHAVATQQFPIVIGGDHSIAVGTWNGQQEPFGLIWIDAHMDAHTPETTPSQACHGMPLAALLGYGAPEMAKLLRKEPVLKPERTVLIGIRSFESEEAALLKKLGVKIYFIDEVKKRSLQEIIPEAIEHAAKGTNRFGISLDLDVFSPDVAPGVDTPVSGGIEKEDLLSLLASITKDQRLIGFEMVEYNPMRDKAHKTRALCTEIMEQLVLA